MYEHDSKPRFLMCRPRYFAVDYAINPWMEPRIWARRRHSLASVARRQWEDLARALRRLGAEIALVPPAPGLPDLVFTANAAVVLDRTALLARFRYPERQQEQPYYEAAFRRLQARGAIDSVRVLPRQLVLEGAGDCVWDEARQHFWLGYGPRSHAAAKPVVEKTFGVEAVALELADPRFYHMDTALCPLPHGHVMYVADAFTPAARAVVEARVAAEDRIEIAPRDADQLAANAVCFGDAVILSACSDALRSRLAECGYRAIVTPLDAFQRSGGSAFCLTLRLDRSSAARHGALKGTAA